MRGLWQQTALCIEADNNETKMVCDFGRWARRDRQLTGVSFYRCGPQEMQRARERNRRINEPLIQRLDKQWREGGGTQSSGPGSGTRTLEKVIILVVFGHFG
jgi:hypothetical protein